MGLFDLLFGKSDEAKKKMPRSVVTRRKSGNKAKVAFAKAAKKAVPPSKAAKTKGKTAAKKAATTKSLVVTHKKAASSNALSRNSTKRNVQSKAKPTKGGASSDASNSIHAPIPVKQLPGIRYSKAQAVKAEQFRKGTITTIKKYGVFVELDSGHSGLVHISELSWGRSVVENVCENDDADIAGFSIGDEVKVKVLAVSDEGKISLSIKQTLCPPFDIQKEEIKKLIGAKTVGAVDAIRDFGAFVRILPGVTGLIPKGEVKKFGKLKVGQSINVYIDSVDWDKKHITLVKEERPVAVQRKKKPDATIVSKKGFVCIDGSNVIGHKCGLRTQMLKALIKALSANGYQYKVFLDKSTFSWLCRTKATADLAYLRELESSNDLIVAPSKVEADGQLLQFAEFEKDSHVISCDTFRDYVKLHPWLKGGKSGSRVHGFNVVPIENGVYRVLIAGFNMDVVVKSLADKATAH